MNTNEDINIRKLKESNIDPIIHLEKRISGIVRITILKSEIKYYIKNNAISRIAQIQDQELRFMTRSVYSWPFSIDNGG